MSKTAKSTAAPVVAKIKVKQVRSGVGQLPAARATLRALGLKRIGHEVIKDDRPEIRGMAKAIQHLVTVETVEEVK
ncbi:MAG: 50S ribosomal protein L30 [Propionibacteriaceae bacterium]|jgi:large subunit ribosomal protein L30|nr:50S ribosomal protein L30 [Propionibacteriaceae bacterium]